MALVVARYFVLIEYFLLVQCQEKPEDWPGSYNICPYKHVYPPTNISIDQFSCEPDLSLNKTCPLFIQLIMSFGGSYVSSGVVPGIQVALDHINASPDILPGYTLHYTLQDSDCDRTRALNVLHAGLLEPPTKIAVVGAGCSVATEATAEISHFYNLTQISCVSSSSELMNRLKFPRHFQMNTAEITLAYGFFGIIKYAEWRKVIIVFEDENLFTTTMIELKRLLATVNISYTEIRFDPSIDPFLNDEDSRIYILSMYATYARDALCKAYRRRNDFHYPYAQLLINGWYVGNWWEGSPEEQEMLELKYGCSVEQRKSLVPFILGPQQTTGNVVPNDSIISDYGYAGSEVISSYSEYLHASRLNISELFVYQLCYDSIWTVAGALNKTLHDIKNQSGLQENHGVQPNTTFGLQHFKYSNFALMLNVYNHLSETNFNGIVGNIGFNTNGSRITNIIDIIQYRLIGDEVIQETVGTVQTSNGYSMVYYQGLQYVWPDGVPYDGVVLNKTVEVHLSLTVIINFLATCGIIFAVACGFLHLHFRNRRVIRLTSPYLNTLIVFGAIILYINAGVLALPTSTVNARTIACNVDYWLGAIGHSLCYGTILVKMVRVYYIFDDPSVRKKTLKDWMLALGVFLLVVIDIVILSTYMIVASLSGRISSSLVPNRENLEAREGIFEINYRYWIFVCNSTSEKITVGVLYGYKVLLQIVALVLAISIRKIKVKGLNNAAYIISAVYVTSIGSVVLLLTFYVVIDLVNTYIALASFTLFIITTAILLLVFIPPLINLYKDPDGVNVFSMGTTHVSEVSQNGTSTNSDCAREISSLQQKIRDLEMELQKSSGSSVKTSAM